MPAEAPTSPDERRAAIAKAVAERKARKAAAKAASGSGKKPSQPRQAKRTRRKAAKQSKRTATTAEPTRRSGRALRPSARAQLAGLNATTDSDSEDTIPDDGAVEVSDEEVYSGSSDDSSTSPESEHEPSRRKRRRQGSRAPDDDSDSPLPSLLHSRDVDNFLKLSSALRILLSGRITDAQLSEADALIRDYCTELLELYGPDVIKSNHRYATHTIPFVKDHGPLHCFWTFLFERMNKIKILKSFHTNNHGGGEIEMTFFREFQRTVRTTRVLSHSSHAPVSTLLPRAVAVMRKAAADERGTVQILAQELDSVHENAGIQFQLSAGFAAQAMPSDLYTIVLRHFRLRLPQVNIRSWLAPAEPGVASVPLQKTAQFFDHVIVDQVKYIASRQLQNRADPVICVRNPVSQELWVGELLDIFAVDQPAIGTHHFGRVRWMRPKEIDVSEGVWQSSAAMGVRFWVLDSFLDPGELGPSPLIDLNTIVAHAVRLQAYVGNELVWATLRINRVGSTYDKHNID